MLCAPFLMRMRGESVSMSVAAALNGAVDRLPLQSQVEHRCFVNAIGDQSASLRRSSANATGNCA